MSAFPSSSSGESATLYLHFPCFDGTISGVLANLYLEKSRGWNFTAIEPVTYDSKNRWLALPLPQNSAVVDFLYHPAAKFWADHHSTTFLTAEARADFERRKGPWLIYDAQSRSCASLLWRTIGPDLNSDPRLAEMVQWADKIDSADYESVEEALNGVAPALVLSRSLLIDGDAGYCKFLIEQLKTCSLAQVAQTVQVQTRFVKAMDLGEAGAARVREAIRMEGGVAVYEANGDGAMINRYLPYRLFPAAKYSIGIIYSSNSIVITSMRNPWLNFESLHLGEFMKAFGGGGHQRVGSVVLASDRLEEARHIARTLLAELNRAPGATSLASNG